MTAAYRVVTEDSDLALVTVVCDECGSANRAQD